MSRFTVLFWLIAGLLLGGVPSPAHAARQAGVPAAAPTAAPVSLRERITATIASPEFRSARIGVQATRLDTGDTIYAHDADRLFVPASNMKLYSTALALTTLGPNYRWRTSVYAASKPDPAGRVAGDIVVFGRGDPSISVQFTSDEPLAGLELLASRVAAAGVRRVAGDLVADESYFMGERFGGGWEWNDLQWRSGAEVSALTVNDNVVQLRVAPAAGAGEPCVATITPQSPRVRISNRALTVPKDGKRWIGVHRPQGSNDIEVWGTLPAGGESFLVPVAVHDPATFFGDLLRAALASRGVVVEGRVVRAGWRERRLRPFDPSAAVELAWIESAPLAAVVHETNKESQNLYAELLLRTAGRVAGDPGADSDDAGLALMDRMLRAAGADAAPLVLVDGSGLSRRNLVTPAATVKLLASMRRHPTWPVFFGSLPLAGVDGTLENRLKATPAAGRLRAKTGTLQTVATLSGVVTTRGGILVAFAIFVNNQPPSAAPARSAVDAIAAALADFE